MLPHVIDLVAAGDAHVKLGSQLRGTSGQSSSRWRAGAKKGEPALAPKPGVLLDALDADGGQIRERIVVVLGAAVALLSGAGTDVRSAAQRQALSLRWAALNSSQTQRTIQRAWPVARVRLGPYPQRRRIS